MDRASLDKPPPAQFELTPGLPWPLGAHWDGSGVNFAVHSGTAEKIELCLFDTSGEHELARLALPGRRQDVWHGYLAHAAPGLIYGLRAHGPWQPEQGLLFNPAKLLLDPYARAIVGRFEWCDAQFAADRPDLKQRNTLDNAAFALKAQVVVDDFEWGDDRSPHVPAVDTVLYELHVKGFTRLHPEIPEPKRGTFAAVAHPASIAHLQRLGVTTVSLLPVHYALDEERLLALGKRNYWGYNSVGYFALSPALASAHDGIAPRDEFRAMVRDLHAADIEVLLDVVFNHSAESDDQGPSISFRGLDNPGYYRLDPRQPARYENLSGCGNTLDIRRPQVLRLVLDSLRYWVSSMHVDGFRFDLASVLGRADHGFERGGAFFTALAQDPVLARVKLIAEPWDLGPGGYQVGGFPPGWLEWNDQFRDGMRRFWLGWQREPGNGHGYGLRGEFALRLCGSRDIYQAQNRSALESVNYVVSHDGMTLRDLVSYNNRHNEANGENNRDGHAETLSFNCGFEGPTDHAGVLALRRKLQRALLACTLLSQGTPMLAAGSELGHSQGGNNNPYNQDNATTWLDWSLADDALCAFTARVLELRRTVLPFGPHWYNGRRNPLGLSDLNWMQADGQPMLESDWRDLSQRTLGCLIALPGRAKAPLLLLVNASTTRADFRLPEGAWNCLLDTDNESGAARAHEPGAASLPVAPHSLQLLAARGAEGPMAD